MSNDEDLLLSPQRKAEHLLYLADAVQKSIKSRRNIVSDMNKEKDSIVDDFEASVTFDSSDATMLSVASTQEQATAFSTDPDGKRPKMSGKGKSEKKSKTKTIADLRQQLHDCKSALVEIKENANLKYLKLKMEHDELDESYAKLKELKLKVDQENDTLKRKLSSAVGADRIAWDATLEANQERLQVELDEVKQERDAAKKELEETKSKCCASCRNKLNPAPKPAVPAPLSRSLWSLFQLDEEAKATTEVASASTVDTICESNSGMVIDQHAAPAAEPYLECKSEAPPDKASTELDDIKEDEPSRTGSTNDDLEADLEAIEQRMKDDIENLSREWKRPPTKIPTKKRFHNHTVRRDLARNTNKRSTLGKTKSSARGTLDTFFSQSIRNLGAEEMDEEKSFYSLQQRSVASSSSKDAEAKQSAGACSVQGEATDSTTSSSSQDGDRHEVGQDVDGGRRASLLSQKLPSLRESFRSLSEEVEDESSVSSSKAFDRRLENLRAKSLRADLMQEKGARKKTPSKSTLRSSRSLGDQKAVHWEDPSKKEDETERKVRKDVEQWAAVDLAPICSLTV